MKKKLQSVTALLMASAMILPSANTIFAADLTSQEFASSFDVNDTLTDVSISSSESDIEPAWILTKKYKVTGDVVFIRTGPGTSYASDGKLYKNDVIYVKSIDNGWAKFKHNGQWRYVYSKYIKAA